MMTTGTASGHNDLLMALRNWLVGTVGWTELEAIVPSPVSDTSRLEYTLRAPGATSGNEFFLWMKTNADVGNGAYGIEIRSHTDYDADLDIGSQEMVSPSIWYNLWQNDINYWFYANHRRVIVVAKVNVSYVSMYAGLLRPFALPTQFTRPFYIGASYSILAPHDVANSRNRFIADPGDLCAYYLNRDQNAWLKCNNHTGSSSDFQLNTSPVAVMWPHRSAGSISNLGSASNADWSSKGLSNIRPNANGERPQFMCHLLSVTDKQAVGVLEGVYSVPGFGLTSEQEASYGSPASTFRMFQNVFRTTARDFMAIEEV